jgi:RNA-directed DNA polymerase
MSGKRQKNQLQLAFEAESRSEAPRIANEGTETLKANCDPESPAITERLMEEVLERENLKEAWKRVKANQGSAGVDGISVQQLPRHLIKHWPTIREQLLNGTYKPQPVRRVEIPKPDGGGVRKLGIPTVLDRFLQQAVMQVLQRRWDPTFSEHSYGFRPNRSARQAVAQAQQYIAAGYRVVVDLDLEKFFDRVNHDKLMGQVAKRIADKRVLKLIRAFLKAGVMENGLVSPSVEGAPQGGPLSPLLSNLVLDELDRELEQRGHRFVRYADDCNIYVRTERAGQRVMEGVTRFITEKLKLKVNSEKSAVARPQERKFLGFSFTGHAEPKRRIAPQAVKRFKQRVREVTRRRKGLGMKERIESLKRYLAGWRGYFSFCQTPSVLTELDSWVRRRLRCLYWIQWKTGRRRFDELHRRGVDRPLAAHTAGSNHGPWRLSISIALSAALSTAFFDSFGLPKLAAGR